MSSSIPHVYGVLLAGGKGTRLWPLSTSKLSKQFLKIGSARSMIQQTFDRLRKLISIEHIGVACGQEHDLEITQQLPELTKNRRWLEPEGKNTLPAIALAAIRLVEEDPQAVMVVTPADHFIPQQDDSLFCKDLELAVELAQKYSALVTLGIPPSTPATGFGYIETGEKRAKAGEEYYLAQQFHEKPDLATAESYLKKGNFFWNAGIFVWKAQSFLEELKKLQPQLALEFGKWSEGQSSIESVYSKIPSLSVDYGIMEKAKNVFVIPASFRWDDVGSLTSFEKALPKDSQNNHFENEVFCWDASGNLVLGHSKPIALLGIHDCVVVNTPEALLILPKSRVQEVKRIVEDLKKNGREDLL